MLAIAWLLRIFSYLFHFVLSLALLALGCVAVLSGAQNLKLDVLPWHGRELNYFLLLAGHQSTPPLLISSRPRIVWSE